MLKLEAGRGSLRARTVTHTLTASTTVATSAPARKAFLSRFERELDPDGTLPLAERQRRTEHGKRAYFVWLAAKSAQAQRREGRAERNPGEDGEARRTDAALANLPSRNLSL